MTATRPGIASLLFGFSAPVGRAAYATTGFALMALKYGLDAALVYGVTKKVWSPLLYLSPVFTLREQQLHGAPEWMFVALALMTLPFIWIGATMSVRRAVDAGVPAWLGIAFFLPVLNYVAMLALAVLPSRARSDGAPASLAPRDLAPESAHVGSGVKAALLGVASSVVLAIGMGGLAIYALKLYGASLFLGTPVVMGASSAFFYNRDRARPIGLTILVAEASVVIAGATMLLFALEGLVCVAMAMPIATVLALFGAVIGRAVALAAASPQAPSAAMMVLLLPLSAAGEAATTKSPLYEVVTTIEIDAPPERVWPNVIGFTELPPPNEAMFRLGIAYPQRATITGTGVGAVRRCEFSTGPFVEPITHWEENVRLSFDVASQPIPMHEWSPYRHVAPPHLDGYMKSERGEFRLVALPGGKTRLEGSTFYRLDMAPNAYWTIWSDALLHSIHGRVLSHIKNLSERQPR